MPHRQAPNHGADAAPSPLAAEPTLKSKPGYDALLRELATYHEELHAQNEQLIHTKQLLEQSRERYSDLFDFAPIPYLVLDAWGIITEVNLTGACFLGCERSKIIGLPLRRFVVFSDRPLVLDHMRVCRTQQARATTTLRMVNQQQQIFQVQMTSRRSLPVDGMQNSYPTALTDLTDRLQAVTDRDLLRQKLSDVQEEERRRLSRELHDELGQHVTALILGLRSLAPSSPVNAQKVEHLLQIAGQLGRESHRIASNLRPAALDDLGLDAAVRQLVYHMENSARIATEYDFVGVPHARLPSYIETAVYRAVQESLSNVAKHAAAQQVSVLIELKESEIHAIIEDDGCGFDQNAALSSASDSGGLGLVGMRERVELAGGSLEIESSPGQGTTVFLRIPLEKQPQVKS